MLFYSVLQKSVDLFANFVCFSFGENNSAISFAESYKCILQICKIVVFAEPIVWYIVKTRLLVYVSKAFPYNILCGYDSEVDTPCRNYFKPRVIPAKAGIQFSTTIVLLM